MPLDTSSVSASMRSTRSRSSHLRNQYYVCPIYQDEGDPWNPYTRHHELEHNQLDYLGRIFEVVEESEAVRDLTFFITWRVDELPRYGSDVVAVIVGDEWGRYPRYTNRVRAVFKMMGADFRFEAVPFRTPPYLTMVTALKYARTQLLRVPGLIQSAWDRRPGAPIPTPVYNIPLGYYKQAELPVKPLSERRHDLYFSGSVVNSAYKWHHPQSWLRTPKDVSRSRLVAALYETQETMPNLDVLIDTRDSFVPNVVDQKERSPERSYSEIMMDTRICPVPRGTRLETGRLYEALRYGCVVISEPLPDRWFLRDVPGVVLHDWANLPDVVQELTAQPDRLTALHEASLAFWEEMCSEKTVGRYIVDKLVGPEDDV